MSESTRKRKKKQTTLMLLREVVAELDFGKYLHYKDLLDDCYQKTLEKTGKYPFRLFAEDSGFESDKLVKLIIKGQRNLTNKSMEKIISSWQLKHERRQYFIALVNYCNEKDANQKSKHFEELLKKKSAFLPDGYQATLLEFFSDWRYPIIKDAIALNPEFVNPKALCDNLYLDLTPKRAKEAIDGLKKLGLVRETEDSVEISEHQITPTWDIVHHSSVSYHQKTVEKMLAAMNSIPRQHCDFNTVTLVAPKSKVAKIRSKMRDLMKEILEIEQEETDEEKTVVLLNYGMMRVIK